VLYYLSESGRRAFAGTVRSLPARWISTEEPGIVPGLTGVDTPPDRRTSCLLSLDGRPLAHAGPHGQTLDWH
jgi:hypothetical protein